MPSLQIIEVIFGLLFLYLLSVTVVLAFNEIFAHLSNLRHKGLAMGLNALLLGDERHKCWSPYLLYIRGLKDNNFFNNPFIKNLGNVSRIAEIPAKTFALAILSCLGYDLVEDASTKKLKIKLINSAENEYKSAYEYIAKESSKESCKDVNKSTKENVEKLVALAGGDLNDSIANIEEWYNNTMEVYYKHWYRKFLLLLSTVFVTTTVVLLNLDSIMIARELWINSFTDKIIENTFEYFEPDSTSVKPSQRKYHQILDELNVSKNQIYRNYKLIGWHTNSTVCSDPRALPNNLCDWFCKIIGLLTTILAISLGAPFWFDILNKILQKKS